MDPSLYKDPTSFNPDGWKDGQIEMGSYSPFGFGKRLCIGITMAKLQYIPILAMILSSYSLSLDKDYIGLEIEPTLVSKPKRDIPVTGISSVMCIYR